jgi:pimeloyl-ACP methyl ester carboxylesterase
MTDWTGTDRTLVLADGRTLGWAEYGDPDGAPVVAVHGSPDSRVVWRLAHDPARRVGVRIVAPDRPGFGLSDPRPGRTVLDWVADHDALIGQLGIDRYAVLAISGGSPYATAVAWARPDRVTRLGLLSVISPPDAPGVLAGADPGVAVTFRLARRAPALLRPIASLMVALANRRPRQAERRLIATRPPADRVVIERPETLTVLRANLPNQFRHAPSIAHEMRLAAADWRVPFDLIVVPTIIWHGGLDDVHTPAMARWLHDAIPASRLVYRDAYATFNFFDDLDDVVAELTATTT